jgi:hypothetical protein
MATKKTRKRAYIPPSHEVVNRRERSENTTTRHATRANSANRSSLAVPPPSWRRTARKLPIYFLLIFALQYFMLAEANYAPAQRLGIAAMQAGLVTLAFAPFMHMMDRFAYNRYLKRSGAKVPVKQ